MSLTDLVYIFMQMLFLSGNARSPRPPSTNCRLQMSELTILRITHRPKHYNQTMLDPHCDTFIQIPAPLCSNVSAGRSIIGHWGDQSKKLRTAPGWIYQHQQTNLISSHHQTQMWFLNIIGSSSQPSPPSILRFYSVKIRF